MVVVTAFIRPLCMAALALALGACDGDGGGPIAVSGIGGAPELRNPNLQPLDPPSALLVEATAQGLVRFDTSGQIEPALAQRWIVSDDGLRYTFRLAHARWAGGGRVTAKEVVARLKAAAGSDSRNRLKAVLGAIDEIVAMTDDVLEISLKSPRPNFLQLLAQPEMAIIRNGRGSGPYAYMRGRHGVVTLSSPRRDEDGTDEAKLHEIRLRGERGSLAVARFAAGESDLVAGGTMGELPLARLARLPAQSLRFDPVSGLFGLAFVNRDGILAGADTREALAMAIDRAGLVADMAVPGLQARESLLPPGTIEIVQPALPGWSALTFQQRRSEAARRISAAAAFSPVTLRVALPAGPGYRLLFAHLRFDWLQIGVSPVAVPIDAPADLRLVDSVAPAAIASWYLRNFTCAASAICSPEADGALDAARNAATREARSEHLARADALLRDAVPFIPLAAPVRWSLVSPRLTGWRANPFGRHPLDRLMAPSD
jgi:peptide/nickel transport system substrate-binding protein